jgi:hypothetical protein
VGGRLYVGGETFVGSELDLDLGGSSIRRNEGGRYLMMLIRKDEAVVHMLPARIYTVTHQYGMYKEGGIDIPADRWSRRSTSSFIDKWWFTYPPHSP